jgi:hypothetical protein
MCDLKNPVEGKKMVDVAKVIEVTTSQISFNEKEINEWIAKTEAKRSCLIDYFFVGNEGVDTNPTDICDHMTKMVWSLDETIARLFAVVKAEGQNPLCADIDKKSFEIYGLFKGYLFSLYDYKRRGVIHIGGPSKYKYPGLVELDEQEKKDYSEGRQWVTDLKIHLIQKLAITTPIPISFPGPYGGGYGGSMYVFPTNQESTGSKKRKTKVLKTNKRKPKSNQRQQPHKKRRV